MELKAHKCVIVADHQQLIHRLICSHPTSFSNSQPGKHPKSSRAYLASYPEDPWHPTMATMLLLRASLCHASPCRTQISLVPLMGRGTWRHHGLFPLRETRTPIRLKESTLWALSLLFDHRPVYVVPPDYSITMYQLFTSWKVVVYTTRMPP